MRRTVLWLCVVAVLAVWVAYATRWQVVDVHHGDVTMTVRTNRYTGSTQTYYGGAWRTPDEIARAERMANTVIGAGPDPVR